MNKTQRTIAAQMLEMAADEFGNHSCNDFELDNTPENLEFVSGMIADSDYPEDDPLDKISQDGKKIHFLMDIEVMHYCARLLREEK